jgi:NADH-quinone oxidoreductase subunit M
MTLGLLIFFPLLAAAVTGLTRGAMARKVAFGASLAELALVGVALSGFDPAAGRQFLVDTPWIPALGISFKAGIDGISMLLVLLTGLLTPIIILSSFNDEYTKPGLFYALILIMQSALMGVFTALDAFLFYIFWEMALIPIYLICLMWGGKDRGRITLKFFIYTLFGSLLMLVAIIWLYLKTPGTHTFDIDALYALQLDPAQQGWLFWAFFLAFAIKMPVFPFHTWQPDTYVNAPTAGTMLLSGIMLKMGTYGLIRWLLPLVPLGLEEWSTWAMGLSVISVVYASSIALVQKDFKRLIAYSSIAHVGLIAAGIFSLSEQGLQGAMIQMLSHGINVVGLFFIAGLLMQRAGTRNADELGGIRLVAPKFATYFMILTLAAVALPLTNGFVGEFLLLTGVYQYNSWVAGAAGLTIILGAVYMLRAYRRICLGTGQGAASAFRDLTGREAAVLVPLVVLVFWIGIYPKPFLGMTGPAVQQLLEIVHNATGK